MPSPYIVPTEGALTEFCACEMGQNAEGRRLSSPSPWSPVLCVLNKSLFTGIAGEESRQAHQPQRVPTNRPGHSARTALKTAVAGHALHPNTHTHIHIYTAMNQDMATLTGWINNLSFSSNNEILKLPPSVPCLQWLIFCS